MDIAWVGESASHDVALVGGKAASLSRLAEVHRVPPAYCLTTTAYDAWSRTVLPATAEPELPPPLPPGLRTSLEQAHAELAKRCAADPLSVAVRSSAVDEDGASASFAGQHETYLNVTGVDAVVDAVLRCWASAISPRALAYRRNNGLRADQIHLAVLVQQLVPADASAVVFSADPVTGRRDQVCIDASYGLGESIVGGSVTPDSYRVDKRTGTVSEPRLGSKTSMVIPVAAGTREVPVPRPLRSQRALTDDQCRACAALATELEDQLGQPVDVECAFYRGELYLLQCRPITHLPDDAGKPVQDKPITLRSRLER